MSTHRYYITRIIERYKIKGNILSFCVEYVIKKIISYITPVTREAGANTKLNETKRLTLLYTFIYIH